MNQLFALLAAAAAGVIGFLAGKKLGGESPIGHADATFFKTTPGSGGFVEGEILKKRMKGRMFHWNRVGTRPASGSWFEIRPKSGPANVLVPPIPKGVDHISADVADGVPPGTIYKYSLWQVLANGQEKELEDPEIEVGQI